MPHQAKDDERPHDQHYDQCDMAEFQGITYAAAHIKEFDGMAREAELEAQVSALTHERDTLKAELAEQNGTTHALNLAAKLRKAEGEVTRLREGLAAAIDALPVTDHDGDDLVDLHDVRAAVAALLNGEGDP